MVALAIPLLPVVSALLIYLLNLRNERLISSISLTFSGITFLLSLLLLVTFIYGGGGSTEILSYRLFIVDPLSVVMTVAVSGISFIVHRYSVRYMQDDQGYARFFVLLDLITASILLTVLANNLILLFIGWHLIGVFLYFLLGYNLNSDSATRFAGWTLNTHRLGDVPLLIAVALLFSEFGTFDISSISEGLLEGRGSDLLVELVGVLVALSAFAKSAQFPLHVWLPYTMEGPTPVSALMHAGIVNAGGFLINRFAPVYYNAELGLHIAFWIGLITAILGSTLMLMQTDIKRSLGYSTVGQMGYMIMECGLGAFSLAIYHLIAHGIFKATLFMGSGGVIHEARKDPNIPEDEVYRFFVERELKPSKLPWILFALITISVPLVIVVLAHLVAGVDIFKYQGALILLFFGWVTGAQTIFSIYRIGSRNVYKLLSFVVLSFTVVVMSYVVIGHSFEKFLYPDREIVDRIYENASVDPRMFEILILFITLVVVGGWLFVYYSSANRDLIPTKFRELYLSLYTHLSRELYVPEMLTVMSRRLRKLSEDINGRLRWL